MEIQNLTATPQGVATLLHHCDLLECIYHIRSAQKPEPIPKPVPIALGHSILSCSGILNLKVHALSTEHGLKIGDKWIEEKLQC